MMSTNKSLVTEEDAKGPKDEIEKIREITWLPLTDLICPSRCITINCLFNLIFKRMADGERVPARESMKYELLRFATFRSCHSVGKPYFILFARAGFYYAEGQVRCYVCGVCMDIDSWTEKEDPSKIHKIYSPRCGFFSDDSGVNIPVPPLSPECMEKFKKLDELTESVDRHVGIQDVPRDEHKPSASRHPEFSEESTRLASFRKWPTTKTQTPRMMAACGFWYSGRGDIVWCFFCGIGLRNWDQDDLPEVEHYRWSPSCSFINQLLLEGTRKEEETILQSGMTADSLLMRQRNFDLFQRLGANHGENNAQPRYDPAIQSVLEMGYSMATIEAAVFKIRENSGMASLSATRIMEVILETEDLQRSNERTPIADTKRNSQYVHETSEYRETYRHEYRTAEVFVSSSSDSDSEGDTFYDALENVPSSGEETIFYDSNEDIIKENDFEASGGVEATGPSSPSNIDKATRKKKSSRYTEEVKSKAPRLEVTNSLCKVCLERSASIVFLPCGHLIACHGCAQALKKCLFCKAPIKGTVRAHFS